jgi:dihydrolipoamide dehydrogenase
VEQALMHGMKTALVNAGPLGGTCLNVGCIPSKMIIYPADRIMEIQEAKKLGIDATINSIDVKSIMDRMHGLIEESQHHMKGINDIENLDYYGVEGYFEDDYILNVGGEKITANKIFIGTGARPTIPPIKGIETIDYLTNETVFNLKDMPKSIIIVGGGYIAVEFAHFFSAMGTVVTILQRNKRLVVQEEPEISETLKNELEKRLTVITGMEVKEISNEGSIVNVKAIDTQKKNERSFKAEKILIAIGRTSNADRLKVDNTGVHLDENGYIKVNDYLETSKKNIWAFGDATGRHMFKHVANEEAWIAWKNAISKEKISLNYDAVPSAIFTYPQIASVGMTEQEAQKHHEILIGYANYEQVAKGEAMVEKSGFSKAIIEKESHKILGFHIIGPYAPILIQEVINAMTLGGRIGYIGSGMHIHPALPELILHTLGNLHPPSEEKM